MKPCLLALSFAVWGHCLAADGAAAPAEIVTSPKLLAEDAPLVAAATAAMKLQCAPLMRYWSDVEAATAEVATAGVAQEAERGWTRRVIIRVALKDEPKAIPASWEAAGRSCYFDFGGGRQPGLDVGMPLCRSLCAVPAPGFVAIPALRGLN